MVPPLHKSKSCVRGRLYGSPAATKSLYLSSESDVSFDEVDDFFGRGARGEDSLHASSFEAGDISSRDYAAADNEDVAHSFCFQAFNNFREKGVVSAGEQGQSYDINVFCVSCFNDLRYGLTKAGINNFHACITESASDNFSAAVMSVEARFCYEYSDFLICHS